MGADAFVSFYGIEIALPGEEASIDYRTDARIVRARRGGLHFAVGRITDGRDHFLLIGKKLADLGLEGGEEATYSDADLLRIQDEVKQKLTAAGFAGDPRLIFKFQAQY